MPRSSPSRDARLTRRSSRAAVIGATLLGATVLVSACSMGPTPGADLASAPAASRRIQVVVAENFWGSIAQQLGGAHADVVSIIDRPNIDPHDYEPTAADGRTVAEASYVISNGVGYDAWMAKLVAADAVDGQRTLEVGRLLGLHAGDNPHRWYFPADVDAVIARITADYQRIDPADSAYFADRRQHYETVGLADYHRLLDEIKADYAGTPVGASESVFAGIAQATGLRLVTPSAFLAAVSEGTDPTAADKTKVDHQISGHQIDVWVYNRQNATPDVTNLTRAAQRDHIPVTTITETMVPAGSTFQQWQSAQLEDLAAALGRATRR